MSKLYFQVIHRLISTGHWITDQISQELKEFGMTEPQYNVLRILMQAGGRPVAVQYIQERMVQRSSNVTRIVDKLVAKQFVVRQECPSNRRKMDISLTTSGRVLLKKLDRKVYAFHNPMTHRLNPNELATLKKLIDKLTITATYNI